MTVRQTVYEAARFWPLILLGLLIIPSFSGGGGVEVVAIIFLLLIQGVWLVLWHGVPWIAYKVGVKVGNATSNP